MNDKKSDGWNLFAVRALTFAAFSFILIHVGEILQQNYPQWTSTYASLALGIYIASIFRAWES